MRSLDRRRRWTRPKPTPVWNAQGPVLRNGGGARHYKEATVSRNQAVEADCLTGVVPGVLRGIGHRNSMTIGGPTVFAVGLVGLSRRRKRRASPPVG